MIVQLVTYYHIFKNGLLSAPLKLAEQPAASKTISKRRRPVASRGSISFLMLLTAFLFCWRASGAKRTEALRPFKAKLY